MYACGLLLNREKPYHRHFNTVMLEKHISQSDVTFCVVTDGTGSWRNLI